MKQKPLLSFVIYFDHPIFASLLLLLNKINHNTLTTVAKKILNNKQYSSFATNCNMATDNAVYKMKTLCFGVTLATTKQLLKIPTVSSRVLCYTQSDLWAAGENAGFVSRTLGFDGATERPLCAVTFGLVTGGELLTAPS